MSAEESIVGTSHVGSVAEEYIPRKMAAIESVAVEADRIDLKIGTLKIDLNHASMGTVELDGQKVRCRSASISFRAGEVPVINLEIIPMPVKR